MNKFCRLLDTQDVRARAAEIRKQWSPAERLRRTGLPPDVPMRLREYILGRPRLGWQTVPCDRRPVH